MRSHSSFRSVLAAMAISLLSAGSLAPAMHSRAGRVVANHPGERLVPFKRKPERKPDPDRQFAAAVKREKKNWKRLWARSQGGWVSSDAWLARVDSAALAAKHELERLS